VASVIVGSPSLHPKRIKIYYLSDSADVCSCKKLLCQTDNINHQHNSFSDGRDIKTVEGRSPLLTEDVNVKDSVSVEEQVSSHITFLAVTHRM
jgi:hypothetical protein